VKPSLIVGRPTMGRWGTRAAERYEPAYASRYRAADEMMVEDDAWRALAQWLGELCQSFEHPIKALDIGCGTGRYFAALSQVRELVGLDASAAMLEQARRPIGADRLTATEITLVNADLDTVELDRDRFDLIYSIGVLAEHVPFTESRAARIAGWLAPNGLFAFTAVHPSSNTVRGSWKRRAGAAALSVAPGPLRKRLRAAWLAKGLYADEPWIRDGLSAAGLIVESIRQLQDVHLHSLVVARKPRGSNGRENRPSGQTTAGV